jgi:hypothetical protein
MGTDANGCGTEGKAELGIGGRTDMNEVEAVKAAIKLASCPGREGPFGGYDYGHNEAFYGPAPEDGRYVIRDFRDPKSPDWGKWLHQTDNREEHEAMFVKMTDDHIAQAAIAALDAVRGDQVARFVAHMKTRQPDEDVAECPATWGDFMQILEVEAEAWENGND